MPQSAISVAWNQFRWYASFHDEGTHPHVHMVCYNADGRSGFLNKDGIAKIKSGLARNIFRQELTEIYQEQTQRRDELVRQSGEVMKELIQQMRSGTLENPRIEQLTNELAGRLKNTSGKKQYGYLKAPLKAVVDEIVDELAKDSRIAAAYDLWYRLREEVLRTYRNDLPNRLPLSQQKEFKRIKNLVIQEAARLGEYTEVFSPEDSMERDAAASVEQDNGKAPAWSGKAARQGNPYAMYRATKRILSDPASKPEQTGHAVDWLTQAAEAGLGYAQFALDKLYRDGGPVDRNKTKAVIWFSQAAEQGNHYTMYALGKLHLEANDPAAALRWFRKSAEMGNQYAQYRLGKLVLNGDGVAKDVADAVRWLTEAAEQGNQHAQFFLDHMDDGPSLFASATWLLHHMGRIFQDQAPPPTGGVSFGDSKLRRKIREKRSPWATSRTTMRSSSA